MALLVTLATGTVPATAASVNASYFTFTDSGSFIDGDGDYWTTRSRAVVDSGFVHQPTGIGLIAGGSPTDWTWHAKASANLATGTLRTYAFTDTTDSGAPEAPPDPGHGWRTQATANWSDAVVFTAPAGAAAAPAATTFSLDVRGNFAGFYSHMTNTSFLMVNGIKSQVAFAWDGRLGPNGAVDATATTLGTVTHLSVDPGQLHAVLEVTVMVTPGTAVSVLGSAISTAAAGPYASATSDFDHTATLSIHVPAGYTFASQSGVLLSVPEPATWLSMFAGLGMIAAALRRRHGDGGTRIPFPRIAEAS